MAKYPKPKDPRDSRKWREFRKMVLNRDGHTCAYCGEPANTVDHVNPISAHPEEAFNLDNCVNMLELAQLLRKSAELIEQLRPDLQPAA